MIIEKSIPLNDKNWFRTGGLARFFVSVKDEQEFANALAHAKKENLDLFVLGGGANVLISDDGFDGLVLQPKLSAISHEDFDDTHVLVHAGAGIQMPQLIRYCLKNNILGLEEFSGIPGTIGGAVYNNMHYFNFSLSDFVHGSRIIERETGKIQDVTKDWLTLGYDNSKLHEKNHYLLRGTFKLKKATELETAFAKGRNTEIIRGRMSRYPTARTCGCFFRNFHQNEVTLVIPGTDKKMVYVAYYLDKLGVKGALNAGDAVVSHQHANMLVNKGEATSKDLIDLARAMQKKVYDNFGVMPQPECELVGFKEYPLLK